MIINCNNLGVAYHVTPRGNKMFLRCLARIIRKEWNQKLFSSTEIEEKLVKAVVIGAPNSGKSTLINTLIGKKVHSSQQQANQVLISCHRYFLFLLKSTLPVSQV